MSCFSQNLYLDELLELRTSNVGQMQEFLLSKNWEIEEIETKESGFIAKFLYHKNNESNTESFLTIGTFDKNPEQNILTIGVNSKENLMIYIKSIKKIGGSLISSKTINEEIISVYKNETNTFKIYSYKAESENQTEFWVYDLLIYSSDIDLGD